MNSLLALAHYDDEVISSAEYLAQNPGSIIFIACGDNPDRKPAFEMVLDKTQSTEATCPYRDLTLGAGCIPYLASFIETLILTHNIDRVITHHPADIHQEHRIVNQAVQIALRRFKSVELLYNKNPEGFPFTEVHWDTVLRRSDAANDLIETYRSVVANLPKPEYEFYQSVRRFSI